MPKPANDCSLWLRQENKTFLSRGGGSGVEIANYSTNQLEQPVV